MIDRHEIVPEMERTPVESGLRLWWFGGPSYAIKSGRSIVYVDPYHSGPRTDDPRGFIRAIDNYLLPEDIHLADLVLSTHNHTDHCDPMTLGPIAAQTNALFAVAPSSAERIASWGTIERARLRTMGPGATLQHGNISLTAFASNDWDDAGAAAFVLQAGGRTVFIGGDTMYAESFSIVRDRFTVDLAVLALARNRLDIIDRPIYMTPEEVVRQARTLGAARVLPVHWDIWRAWAEDPHAVEPYIAGSGVELVILAQGGSLSL